jgi:O-antigen/teichoic acid export membrane protein
MKHTFMHGLSVSRSGYLRNVLVLMSWTAAAQVVSAAAMLVLPRLFQPQHFGVFSVFSAFVVLAAIVAAARYEFAIGLPAQEEQGVALFTLCMGLCAVAAAACFALVQVLPPDNLLYHRFPEMRPWWSWIAAGVAFVGWYNATSYLALRRGQFQTVGKSKACVAIVTVAGQTLAGLIFGGTDSGLVFPFLAGQLAGVLVLGFGARAQGSWRVGGQALVDVARRFIRFPKYVAPGSLLDGIAAMLPVSVVAATLSLADAGYYALAERALRMPVTLIGSSVLQVFYRQMAELRHDAPSARRLLVKTWWTMALIAVAPCAAIALFGESIFGFVFGSTWSPSGRVAEVLVAWVLAQFISYPTSNVLVVQERTGSFLLWQSAQLTIVASSLLLANWLMPGSLEWTVALLVTGQVIVCALSMALQWRATAEPTCKVEGIT